MPARDEPPTEASGAPDEGAGGAKPATSGGPDAGRPTRACGRGEGARRRRAAAHHPCLDPESGFFREEHFALSLKYEIARSLEAEKPLGLLLVSFGGAFPASFAGTLRERLRRIDLPSRLGPGEAAVIMPRVIPSRAGRLIERLGADLAGEEGPGGGPPLFGVALAWPNDSATPDGLLAKARASLDAAAAVADRLLNGKGPFAEAETQLAAEERDSLFAGFSRLTGGIPADPGDGSGPGGGGSGGRG
jgi:GGDEF domain-containing protein